MRSKDYLNILKQLCQSCFN
uniref:Uncharacterized protein n=1 Tax=Arundo donax TaxID=35708 RepID=A0A0A9BHR8_ARUDO